MAEGWRPDEEQTLDELREIAADWDRRLAEFDRHIWPTFRKHGISKSVALLLTFHFEPD